MAGKAVFVLVDGLRDDTAREEMGYLESCVSHGSAARWTMHCELPSLSRPLYHTVHTGLTPQQHGVTSNDHSVPSSHESIFSLANSAGRRTAAAAHGWFAELYNHLPYDPVMGREVEDQAKPIQYGRFFIDDDFPDTELMRTGDMLIKRFSPDYILMHPIGCDHLGHLHGGTSHVYRRNAAQMDNLLSLFVPDWQAAGYEVFVSADHGMDAEGWHGGTKDEVRNIPFYHIGAAQGGVRPDPVRQVSVAPTLLDAIGLPPGSEMTAPSLFNT